MKLSLKQLEAFVWVADLGSFRKAAERLNTTQPNISSRISSLEIALKLSLMERDAGSVRLTTKGRELLEHARSVLRETDSLIEAADNAVLYNGILKLGVTELIVHTWLRDYLRVLKEHFADVPVELTVDISANIKTELHSRSIDLAFQSGPFARQTSGQQDLGSYPLIWVASRLNHELNGAVVSLEQLTEFPILTHARNTLPYQQLIEHIGARRDVSARIVPSSNFAACLQMTIDGMGIAVLPAAMMSDELESGELYQINYSWVPDNLHFLARYDAIRSPGFVAKAAEIAAEVASDYVNQSAV